MRSRIVAAAALFAVVACTPTSARAHPGRFTAAAVQREPSPTTVRVRGTIAGYDVPSGVLSLTTATGLSRFEVSSVSRVRRSGRTLEPRELQTFKGYRAAVRYSDSDGHRTVESVNVFGKS